MNTLLQAGALRPLDEFLWQGFHWRCERLARRTIFARALGEPLDGARIQIKKRQVVRMTRFREEVQRGL